MAVRSSCHPERERALAVLGMAIMLALAACRQQPELPKLFPVPHAQLIDESGKPVNLASLRGQVAVYDFIFTSCTGTCPIMTNNMRALTKKTDSRYPVRFVSITVDPSRDTPEVLGEYAKRVRNDPRWIFLTGDKETIIDLSVKGFKLAAGDPMPGGEALLHSSRFAVADKEGVIRAYVDGTDAVAVDQAVKTISRLVRE